MAMNEVQRKAVGHHIDVLKGAQARGWKGTIHRVVQSPDGRVGVHYQNGNGQHTVQHVNANGSPGGERDLKPHQVEQYKTIHDMAKGPFDASSKDLPMGEHTAKPRAVAALAKQAAPKSFQTGAKGGQFYTLPSGRKVYKHGG